MKTKLDASYLASKFGYKPEIVSRYMEIFGSDVLKFLEANEKPPIKAIRVNTLKIDPESLIGRLEAKGFKFKPVRWLDYAFIVEEEPYSIGATTEYLLGYYYIQDPTSMIPPVELEPKGIVLDMCAAPGGKTTHIAQIMRNKGVIVAVDIDREKMKALRSNLHRLGVKNVIAYRMDARDVVNFGMKFDCVLVDAPCSGEGVVRKDPGRKSTIDLSEFEFYSRVQKELLNVAIKVTKKGGTIVYATCTVAPEENEAVINAFLDRVEVVDTKIKGIPGFTKILGMKFDRSISKTQRFYPHIHDTQSFFVAKMVKK